MLEQLVARAPVFLLVYARVMALILTLPLFSTQTIRFMAKVALGFFMAYLIYPQVSLATGTYAAYASFITVNGEFNLVYVLLLLGEALIGIIIIFTLYLVLNKKSSISSKSLIDLLSGVYSFLSSQIR